MALTVNVETVIGEHYNDQLRELHELDPEDKELKDLKEVHHDSFVIGVFFYVSLFFFVDHPTIPRRRTGTLGHRPETRRGKHPTVRRSVAVGPGRLSCSYLGRIALLT